MVAGITGAEKAHGGGGIGVGGGSGVNGIWTVKEAIQGEDGA